MNIIYQTGLKSVTFDEIERVWIQIDWIDLYKIKLDWNRLGKVNWTEIKKINVGEFNLS